MSRALEFERVFVAFDGSEQALEAAQLAFAVGARGARITLVHVLEVPEPYPELPEAAAAFERLVELAEEDWRERLAAVAIGPPERLEVDTEVIVAEKAAPALLGLLRERRADLLVAGTSGVGGLKRNLLGSVSQQLLQHAPCSVLLARSVGLPEDRRCVVAGLDGSELTGPVVAASQALAVALAAELVLVHVVDEHVPFASVDATRSLREWAHGRAEQILGEARAGMAAPLESVLTEVREGHTRDQLVTACEERRPAALVVGSRGLHGFKGLLLGSTARHLVNHAPCPVLVVRADAEQERR